MLELADIRKAYWLGPIKIDALRGVDLGVEAGDLLSIVGPSGSGKSTLMNVLVLLGRPTIGSYRVSVRDVSALNDRELSAVRNAYIGFAFQSFNLLGHLMVLENTALPLVYRGSGRRAVRQHAQDVLDKVGMDDRLDHRDQFSGGQKQRVAIARVLVGTPSAVLADEPTGTLDSDSVDEVMRRLIRLDREEGIAVVIIRRNPVISTQCRRGAPIQDGILLEAVQEAQESEAP